MGGANYLLAKCLLWRFMIVLRSKDDDFDNLSGKYTIAYYHKESGILTHNPARCEIVFRPDLNTHAICNYITSSFGIVKLIYIVGYLR